MKFLHTREMTDSTSSSCRTSMDRNENHNKSENEQHSSFDVANLPDVLSEQLLPDYNTGFRFFKEFSTVFAVLNQLIVIWMIVNYFQGKSFADENYEEIINKDINNKLIEIQWDLNLLSKKIDGAIHKESENLREKTLLIQNYVTSKINEAIDLYDADKVGLQDYALESAGASIISTPDTKSYLTRGTYKFLGWIEIDTLSNPRELLHPGIMPGQCYAFYGSRGRIRIKLSRRIKISSIAIEQADSRLIEDSSSSPKDLSVYGLAHEEDEPGDLLGVFMYNININQLQVFPINMKVNKTHEFLELRVLSNHGHPEYTCVYRLRVHGTSL